MSDGRTNGRTALGWTDDRQQPRETCRHYRRVFLCRICPLIWPYIFLHFSDYGFVHGEGEDLPINLINTLVQCPDTQLRVLSIIVILSSVLCVLRGVSCY